MRISDWSSDVCSSVLEPASRASGIPYKMARRLYRFRHFEHSSSIRLEEGKRHCGWAASEARRLSPVPLLSDDYLPQAVSCMANTSAIAGEWVRNPPSQEIT